jgi:hypothetical protein
VGSRHSSSAGLDLAVGLPALEIFHLRALKRRIASVR